jgi:hypothetical protein
MRKYLAYERADRDELMRRSAILCLCGALLTIAPPAFAQSMGEAIGNIFDGASLRNAPPSAPDFVVNSRPEGSGQDYLPYASPDAAASREKKTAKDFEAIGAELRRAGAVNRQRAAQVKTPGAAPGSAPKAPARPTRSADKAAN